MKSRLVLGLFALLTGCTSLSEAYIESRELIESSYMITTSDTNRSSKWVLARQTHFYLARNNELTALNSKHSDELTALISEAIQDSFRHATVGLLPESINQALHSADRLAADFLVFPSIMMWDDRASTWTETFDALSNRNSTEAANSGAKVPKLGLDTARLQLIVIHAASGKVFDVVRINSSSGVLTLYEDTPDKVVLPSLKSFFAELVAASG